MVGSPGTEDRAVSEATGVAILVGFTVLVTASVGIGVLFLEDGSGGPPSANFSFEHYSGSAMLIVTHERGDELPAGQLVLKGDGGPATWADIDSNKNDTDPVGPGDPIQLADHNAWGESVTSGDTVEIHHEAEDGNTTLLDAWDGS